MNSKPHLFKTTHMIISVYDKVTDKYDQPFTSPTKQDAIRSFRNACETPTSPFAKFPHDYELKCLGHWTDDGTIDTYENPETLASPVQFRTENKDAKHESTSL